MNRDCMQAHGCYAEEDGNLQKPWVSVREKVVAVTVELELRQGKSEDGQFAKLGNECRIRTVWTGMKVREGARNSLELGCVDE